MRDVGQQLEQGPRKSRRGEFQKTALDTSCWKGENELEERTHERKVTVCLGQVLRGVFLLLTPKL